MTSSKLTRRDLFSLGRSSVDRGAVNRGAVDREAADPSRAASNTPRADAFDLEGFYAARSPSSSSRLPHFAVRSPKPGPAGPISTSRRGVPDLPRRRGRS